LQGLQGLSHQGTQGLQGADNGGVTFTNDTSTNATRYIIFGDVTEGVSSNVGVSDTKLVFNPSSGSLGVGIGSTNPTSKLQVQGNTNISNISFSNVSYASSFSISAQETSATEVFFSNDGRTAYVLGDVGYDITWYTLGTAWDITSSSYVSEYSVSGQLTQPRGLYFKPDGTKFYLVGTAGVGAAATSVNQYTCSTPWDLTTASYDNISFSVISEDTVPTGVEFSSDGSKFYISGATNDTIYQYSCSTPWNVSTASYDSVSFAVGTEESVPQSIRFSLDGTKFLVVGNGSDSINHYKLNTPWDISTASFVGIVTSVLDSIGDTNSTGFYWKPDGTRIYVCGVQNDALYQFNVTSDADLEVIGETKLYGNTEIYENLKVYGDAYYGNKVGIGTTNPTQKLDIIGNQKLFGKIIAGDSVNHPNIVNVLNFDASLGVTAFRPINLIDTSGVIKVARLNDTSGSAIELQQWDTTLTTLISRSLLTAENSNLVLQNVTTGGRIRLVVDTNNEVASITSTGVGIGTTNPTSKLTVLGGDIRVGINTTQGIILTSANGSKYRLIVDNSGILSTSLVL
jgi:sugar lactone lactonase YvrE